MLPERQPNWFGTVQFLDFTRYGKEVDANGNFLFTPYNDIRETIGFNIASFTASDIVSKRSLFDSPLSYRRTAFVGITNDYIPMQLQNNVIHRGRFQSEPLRRIPRNLTDTPDHVTQSTMPVQVLAGVSDEYFLHLNYTRTGSLVDERVRSPVFVGGGYAVSTVNHEAFLHAGFDAMQYRFPERVPFFRSVGMGGMVRSGILRPSIILKDLTADYTNVQVVPQLVIDPFNYPIQLEFAMTAARGYFVETRTAAQWQTIAEFGPEVRAEDVYEAKSSKQEYFYSGRVRLGGFTFEMFNDSFGGKDKGPSYGVQVSYRLRYPQMNDREQSTTPTSRRER